MLQQHYLWILWLAGKEILNLKVKGYYQLIDGISTADVA